jgi:integrase
LVYDRKKQAAKDKVGVVELRIYAGKVRKYISTGVKLLPKEWKNGAVTGRDDMVTINRQLQSLVNKCNKIITEMMEADNVDLDAIPNILKDRLRQKQTFLEYAKECAERKMKGLRVGTQKRYKVVLNFLEEWKGLVYFADVTEENIRKMDEYLEDRKLKQNSRYNYHKTVKIFVRQAFDDGLIVKNPYTKLKIKRGDEDGSDRFLTPEEFHRFEKCKIDAPHLARVRDLFVFQTYTAMSYGDLAEFDYRQCWKMNGYMVYRSSRIKTEQPFTIVLLKPALAILQKYDYKLPIISNVKYNDYLKSAVTYAKIDKNVTTHWARHTGATMLVNEGNVPMHIVQHILGHASIRETERTYAKVLDGKIVESMASYQKRSDKKRKGKGIKKGEV